MEKKTTLYELDHTIRTILENGFMLDEETGEYKGSEDLDALQMERGSKVESVALYLKEIECFGDRLSEESKRLAERSKAYQNKAERIRNYLIESMQGAGEKAFETVKVKLGIRSSTRVETDDTLPQEWKAAKVSMTPDKVKIKEALKHGVEIPGAKLVTAYSLQVK